MGTALTTREAALALGVSERHARRVAPDKQLAALPVDAQAAWAMGAKVVQFTAPQSSGQMALSLSAPMGANLSPEDQAEVRRRFGIIEPLLKPDQFRTVWLAQKNSKVQVIDWLAAQHNLARRTIYNWLDAWKQSGITGLIPRDRSDKGRPRVITAAALDFLVAAAFPKHGAYGKMTVRDIYRAYGEERQWRIDHAGKVLKSDVLRSKYARYLTAEGTLAPAAQLPEASYSTFRNWYDRIPDICKVMARDGDEAFHNTQEILSFREISAVRPLEYVVMDHRRLDFFCLIAERGGWKLARPWLTAAIDMRTRKWLGWCIVETPSSDSIAATLKRVFIDYGLPEAVYWDNGKDFRCEWLEGRNSREESRKTGELDQVFRGVMDTLGIRVHHAIVRRARSKIIEPNFGRTSKFDRTLPWWCGHNPGARPAERMEKLLDQHEAWLAGQHAEPAFPTIEQVAAFYSAHLEELNDRDMEGAEGMNKVTPTGRGWMCPNEAWEKLIPTVEKRMVTAEVLQLCFAKRKELTVQHGHVQTTFGGKVRRYRLIGNPVRLAAFNGRVVEFAYDPLDLQTAAIYCESRLVGIAECLELRRMGEDSFVEDERNRRVMRREVKKFIDTVHRNVHVPGHEERTARRAVTPRVEPARLTVPAAIPGEIAEAVEAVARDHAMVAPVEVERVPAAEVPAAGDDEFNFFA